MAGPAFAEPDTVAVDMRLDSIVKTSMKYIGMGYCRGGVGGSDCFDCSGFVSRIYAAFGYKLPHSSAAIALEGKAVKRKDDIMVGDLIYFKGSNAKSKKVGHVGIVVQNDGYAITFIHASINKGICLDELESSDYYTKRYLGARRIIY